MSAHKLPILCLCAYVSHSVVSDSVRPRGLRPARLPCPWDSPGKSTGEGSHSLLQGIFPTQGSNQVLTLQVDSIKKKPPSLLGTVQRSRRSAAHTLRRRLWLSVLGAHELGLISETDNRRCFYISWKHCPNSPSLNTSYID